MPPKLPLFSWDSYTSPQVTDERLPSVFLQGAMSFTGGRETILSRKAAGKDPYNRDRGIAFAVGGKPETPEGDFAANRGTPRSVPYSFSSSRNETGTRGSRLGGR